MNQFKIKDYGEGRLGFYCPGCKHEHIFFVNSEYWTRTTGKPGWTFNGDFHNPTFSPSLLNRWGTFVDPNWQPPDGEKDHSGLCHLFVTNGQIQFLGDCTHDLAGQTIELPEID